VNDSDRSALLARAARRAAERTDYLAWVFGRYAETERVTEQDFCAILGISALDFQRLCLCLRPRHDSFVKDVEQIAARFELDRGELARITRHVEATEAMKQDTDEQVIEEVGLMLAARARGKGKKSPRNHGKRKKP
jgi:hypothetical protein